MIKIGITGSIAAGKTTASKILSKGRGPLFSADRVVTKFYKTNKFKKMLSREFKIDKNCILKTTIKKTVLNDKKKFLKLEKIIHPLVRSEMKKFTLLNKCETKIF